MICQIDFTGNEISKTPEGIVGTEPTGSMLREAAGLQTFIRQQQTATATRQENEGGLNNPAPVRRTERVTDQLIRIWRCSELSA